MRYQQNNLNACALPTKLLALNASKERDTIPSDAGVLAIDGPACGRQGIIHTGRSLIRVVMAAFALSCAEDAKDGLSQ